MARISVELPEKFNFSLEIPVRVSDLNYGNHLGNDAVLTLAHEARVQFLKSMGYNDEMSIEGVGVITTDAAVVYKSEAFLHDKLSIEIAVADKSAVGFDLIYKVSKICPCKDRHRIF